MPTPESESRKGRCWRNSVFTARFCNPAPKTRSDLLFTMSDNTRPMFSLTSNDTNAKPNTSWTSQPAGGARRDRTDDLLLAKQALSQLSYGPSAVAVITPSRDSHNVSTLRLQKLVGLGRFELPTSRLSSARSNQLSYKPPAGRAANRRRRSGAAQARP